MITKSIDYTVTYFNYSTPAPIISKPTNKSLIKQLKTELHAKASSVGADVEYVWIQ